MSGCLDLLRSGPEGENNDGDGVSVGQDRNDNPEVKDFGYRIDFQDQTGALGHVAQQDYSTDEVYDDLVNEKSEAEWQELDRNDVNRAQTVMDNNDTSIEEIRPWVERALNRNLEEPDIETMDSPPGEGDPDETAIIYGVGMGINNESLISSSLRAAEVIVPLVEKFSQEYLDERAENWILMSAFPETEMEFAHSTMPLAYEHEGEYRMDLVEPAVPDTIRGTDHAIRDAENSVYAGENENFVTPFDFSKAQQMAKEDKLEKSDRGTHPYRAVSAGITAGLSNMVDNAQNDTNMSEVPSNGILSAVSESFGNSIQDAYYNPTGEKVQQMKNVGRAITLFYDEKGWNSELGIGGTLENPEIYDLNEDGIQRAWEKYGELDMSEFTEQHVEG